MAIHVLRDPRPYLLSVMAVALIVMVPLMFAFVTLTDRLYWTDFGADDIVLWAVVGLLAAGLLGTVMAILSRATKESDAEHDARHRQQPS
jgi:hypothetical protein